MGANPLRTLACLNIARPKKHLLLRQSRRKVGFNPINNLLHNTTLLSYTQYREGHQQTYFTRPNPPPTIPVANSRRPKQGRPDQHGIVKFLLKKPERGARGALYPRWGGPVFFRPALNKAFCGPIFLRG